MRNSCRTVTIVPRPPGDGSKTTSPALSDSPPMDRQAMRWPGSSFKISESHSMVFVLVFIVFILDPRSHHPVRGHFAGARHLLDLLLPEWCGFNIAPHLVKIVGIGMDQGACSYPYLSVFIFGRRQIAAIQNDSRSSLQRAAVRHLAFRSMLSTFPAPKVGFAC